MNWLKKKSKEEEEQPQFIMGHIPIEEIDENDVIVIQCKKQLSIQEREQITKYFKDNYPHREMLLLDDGLEIGVLKGLKKEEVE